ncbi:hypothetical protein ABCS02_32365 [Microbacterium sp. X-17]|uniref:hypothetical protein n=1 Tax=Microbacterium sp. X-17 TaxID=3144404 RepID=UPI0031F579A6
MTVTDPVALSVAIVSLVVAALSATVAIISVVYARRSARAAESSAAVSTDRHRRDREPQLRIWLPEMIDVAEDKAIYHLINDGPDDLDSVVIFKPFATDDLSRPIAITGEGNFRHEIQLGALPMGVERRFTVAVGAGSDSRTDPDLRLRIVCTRGSDTWTLVKALEDFRFHIGIY